LGQKLLGVIGKIPSHISGAPLTIEAGEALFQKSDLLLLFFYVK